MSKSGMNVLVVDDDPDLLAVHALYLRSMGYEVLEALDSQQALEKVHQAPEKIDAILADIVMPGMDGYGLCKNLKNNPDTQDIPLIFISQLTTLEEKVKGFAVGADDYIVKPIEPEELGYKIKTLQALNHRNKALQQQLSETQSVAMQAMTYSSDMGQIVEFFKKTLGAEDFKAISELLFEVTNSYGLSCSLQILTPDRLINFGHRGEISPLEANVIELWRPKGRFIDFGLRTLINYEDFSLLIKNMPLEDAERYGMLKDLLGTLCNAIEARVKFLLYEDTSIKKEQIVSAVLGLLEEIDKAFSGVQNANLDVIENMMDDIDETILEIGLTSEQDNTIRKIAANCRDSSKRVFEQGVELYDKFEAVRQQLDRVLGSGN